MDLLRCPLCKANVYGKLPSGTHPEVYQRSLQELRTNLVESHARFCPWRVLECPESFGDPPFKSECLLNDLVEKIKTHLSYGEDLPRFTDVSRNAIVPEDVYDWLVSKIKAATDEALEEETVKSSVLVALTGWDLKGRGRLPLVYCKICQRQCGTWNYLTLQDDAPPEENLTEVIAEASEKILNETVEAVVSDEVTNMVNEVVDDAVKEADKADEAVQTNGDKEQTESDDGLTKEPETAGEEQASPSVPNENSDSQEAQASESPKTEFQAKGDTESKDESKPVADNAPSEHTDESSQSQPALEIESGSGVDSQESTSNQEAVNVPPPPKINVSAPKIFNAWNSEEESDSQPSVVKKTDSAKSEGSTIFDKSTDKASSLGDVADDEDEGETNEDPTVEEDQDVTINSESVDNSAADENDSPTNDKDPGKLIDREASTNSAYFSALESPVKSPANGSTMEQSEDEEEESLGNKRTNENEESDDDVKEDEKDNQVEEEQEDDNDSQDEETEEVNDDDEQVDHRSEDLEDEEVIDDEEMEEGEEEETMEEEEDIEDEEEFDDEDQQAEFEDRFQREQAQQRGFRGNFGGPRMGRLPVPQPRQVNNDDSDDSDVVVILSSDEEDGPETNRGEKNADSSVMECSTTSADKTANDSSVMECSGHSEDKFPNVDGTFDLNTGTKKKPFFHPLNIHGHLPWCSWVKKLSTDPEKKGWQGLIDQLEDLMHEELDEGKEEPVAEEQDELNTSTPEESVQKAKVLLNKW